MSIGTILDFPSELEERISTILAAHQICVERVGNFFKFNRRMARIDGVCRLRKGHTFLWLTFPKAHAFNPFFWYFDFALSVRIERALLRNGAAISDWRAFADGH
jgi:hypothetical protein